MGYRTRSTSTPLPHLGQMRHRVLHAAQPSRQISHRRAVVGLVRILIDSPHPALHLRQPACTPAPGGAQASSTAQRGRRQACERRSPRRCRPACARLTGCLAQLALQVQVAAVARLLQPRLQLRRRSLQPLLRRGLQLRRLAVHPGRHCGQGGRRDVGRCTHSRTKHRQQARTVWKPGLDLSSSACNRGIA